MTQHLFLIHTCRPCCRCCTWPPDTGSGTGVRTASAVPQTQPGTLVPHLDPCTRRAQPGAPCRWCSPGTHDREHREILLTFCTSARSQLLPARSGRYLLRRTFYFLQVLLHHLLWGFPCVRGDGDRGRGEACGPGAGCIGCGWCRIKGLPLRVCFLVVFRQQWPKPGTGLMSLLLTGGGCSTSLGGLVRHTGRAAALIRIPVIPETDAERESQRRDLLFYIQPYRCIAQRSGTFVAGKVFRWGPNSLLHTNNTGTFSADDGLEVLGV